MKSEKFLTLWGLGTSIAPSCVAIIFVCLSFASLITTLLSEKKMQDLTVEITATREDDEGIPALLKIQKCLKDPQVFEIPEIFIPQKGGHITEARHRRFGEFGYQVVLKNITVANLPLIKKIYTQRIYANCRVRMPSMEVKFHYKSASAIIFSKALLFVLTCLVLWVTLYKNSVKKTGGTSC
ncbi:hypothetical protein OAN95_02250 [Alphaproteobacteria bacterium]|nr:hypothetical protein [Alphaproteobacteria bacterium]